VNGRPLYTAFFTQQPLSIEREGGEKEREKREKADIVEVVRTVDFKLRRKSQSISWLIFKTPIIQKT